MNKTNNNYKNNKNLNILIIDNTTTDELHTKEFTRPVVDIIKNLKKENNAKSINYEIMNFKNLEDINFEELNKYNKIILCGTAILDFEYLKKLDMFKKYLLEFMGDVLGICAGAQIIGSIFECQLFDDEKIGFEEIKIIKNINIFEGVSFTENYCLHRTKIKFSDEKLKKNNIEINIVDTNNQILFFRIGRFYASMFHIEVRNKKLIENFLFM